jgi:polysaccharide pyruvyl transferase WcaK-like protein
LTQPNTRVGLLHHVGGGNLEDDATLDAVADNIKRRWPNAEIAAFSMNPDDTETRHGIMSYPIRRKGWTIGYKPARTEATLKETVRALTRKHKAVFYLLKATNAVVRLPSEMFHELWFLALSRRNIMSVELLIISGGGQLTEENGPWGSRCMFLNLGAGPLSHPLSKFLGIAGCGLCVFP